jgi:hypothetical protein
MGDPEDDHSHRTPCSRPSIMALLMAQHPGPASRFYLIVVSKMFESTSLLVTMTLFFFRASHQGPSPMCARNHEGLCGAVDATALIYHIIVRVFVFLSTLVKARGSESSASAFFFREYS